jgi:hypothetical protein
MTATKPELNPNFPWHDVTWGGAEDRVSDRCSLCGRAIDEHAVPLRLWKKDGSAVVFCDGCAHRLFAKPAEGRT